MHILFMQMWARIFFLSRYRYSRFSTLLFSVFAHYLRHLKSFQVSLYSIAIFIVLLLPPTHALLNYDDNMKG